MRTIYTVPLAPVTITNYSIGATANTLQTTELGYHLAFVMRVLYQLPCMWIYKAMHSLGALACACSSQNEKTLKTKAGATIAAPHFVALRPLRVLLIQIFFGHGYTAFGTLLGARFSHPL